MAVLLYLLVFLLPLGTRQVLGSVTPGFHEYEALFLYATDFFVIICVAYGLFSKRGWLQTVARSGAGAVLGAFLVAAAASIIDASSVSLSIYVVIRLALLIVMMAYLAHEATQRKIFQGIVTALAIAAFVQSFIGITQVVRQQSVGLQKFGEPVLVSYTGAASTIKVEQGRLLRAYGTFPHPNVLGAFLVIGLLCLLYWYAETERRLTNAVFPEAWRKVDSMKKAWAQRQKWTRAQFISAGRKYFSHPLFAYRMLIAAATFVVMLGLALTFSRSAWIAGAISVLILLVWILHQSFGAGIRVLGLLVVSIVTLYIIVAPIVAPRATVTGSEPAVQDRFIYNDIGIETLATNPFGVGAGNQVWYGVSHQLYQKWGMKSVWDWEPVHNLYILIATELGWLGLLSFIVFLGIVLWQLVRSGPHLETGIATALLIALLIVGLFDHYLWDLQPGKLMLWLVIGLGLSQLPVIRRHS